MAPVYKCIVCKKTVSSRQHAVCCDSCDGWQHRKCNSGITLQDYRSMCRGDLTIDWQCNDCRPTLPDDQLTTTSKDTPASLELPPTQSRPSSPGGNLSTTFTSRPSDPLGTTSGVSAVVDKKSEPEPSATKLTHLEMDMQHLDVDKQRLDVDMKFLDMTFAREKSFYQPRRLEFQGDGAVGTPERPAKVRRIIMASGNFNLVSSSDSDSSDEDDHVRIVPATLVKPTPVPRVSQIPVQDDSSSESDVSDEDDEEEDQDTYPVLPVTYEVIHGSSQHGKDMLVDSNGYSYSIKRRRGERTTWWCTAMDHTCYAIVSQQGSFFTPGIGEHLHFPPLAAEQRLRVNAKLREEARRPSVEPASKLVDRVIQEFVTSGTRFYYKDIRTNLVQMVRRRRLLHRRLSEKC